MCLDTIDKKIRKVKYGYKVYRVIGGELRGQFYHKFVSYPENEWIEDGRRMFFISSYHGLGSLYNSGFHVFTNKRAAKHWASLFGGEIHKVEVKDIVASGTQDGHNVVVCRQKKILLKKPSDME